MLSLLQMMAWACFHLFSHCSRTLVKSWLFRKVDYFKCKRKLITEWKPNLDPRKYINGIFIILGERERKSAWIYRLIILHCLRHKMERHTTVYSLTERMAERWCCLIYGCCIHYIFIWFCSNKLSLHKQKQYWQEDHKKHKIFDYFNLFKALLGSKSVHHLVALLSLVKAPFYNEAAAEFNVM